MQGWVGDMTNSEELQSQIKKNCQMLGWAGDTFNSELQSQIKRNRLILGWVGDMFK